MKIMDHPHICELKEVFYTRSKLALVMELCDGGELYDVSGLLSFAHLPHLLVSSPCICPGSHHTASIDIKLMFSCFGLVTRYDA